MDNFGLPNRLCEMDESDFPNILEDEIFDPAKLDNYDAAAPEWLDIFDDPVLNDRMMSEAVPAPAIKSEHSYSLNKNGHLTLNAQALEDDSEPATNCINPMLLGDMETEGTSVQQQRVTSQPTNFTVQSSQGSGVRTTFVKQEPKVIVQAEPLVFETRRPAQQQSLLKQNAIVLTTQVIPKTPDRITMHKVFPKTEPADDDDVFCSDDLMPMTPPSSASSDSEGGQSPQRSPPPSPCHQVLITNKASQRHLNPATAMFSQPIPTSGILVLTEEEKRTLISEGYPVPTKLPLTKHEEKNLKKVRRKIKNKISAQESRRKKKEYLDQLEKKVEDVAKENNDLRKKCENYESSNRSLISQLAKLQNMLKMYTPHPPQTVTQTGTCVMILVLCFAVFLGNWSPIGFGNSFGYGSATYGMSPNLSPSSMSSQVLGAYDTPSMKSSRTLMTMTEDATCGNEPWPLLIARRSFECIAQFISDYPTVESVQSHPANSVDSSTDIPFTVQTADGFTVA